VNGALFWLLIAAAGAFHGLNPAMGWLFAVGLGMQDRSLRSLLGALPFIAIGHALSVGLFVLLLGVLSFIIDPRALQLACAALLVGFGIYKLIRWRRHPRWVGMRVGRRDLVVWSFLMATAHGAGLMLAPILLGLPPGIVYEKIPNQHVLSLGWTMQPLLTGILAVALHTAAMLLVATVIAVVVYESVGVGILRRAWINLDLPWGVSLIGAGMVMAAL
jgi:hypothetical protein